MRPYVSLLRRERDFRRVYIAQLVSLAGDWFAIVPLLSLLAKLTHHGLMGGLVLAADTLLFALFAPYAGSIADRVDRRRILVTADLFSAVLICALLAVRSSGTAWIAVITIGAVAAAKSFYQPASSAALPNLVDRPDLPLANVLAGASWGTMLVVGAALGGLLSSAIGPYWCFAVDAVSFGISALLTAATTRPFQEAATKARVRAGTRADMHETIGYVRSNPDVAALVTVKSGVGIGNGTLTLFPLISRSVFHVGSLGTGLFFAMRGLGALTGPLLAGRYAAKPGRRLRAVAVFIALFGVSYSLFGIAPYFGLAIVLVGIGHLGGGANWVLSTYALQDIVPDNLRGRVFSLDYMIVTFTMSIAQIVAGVLSAYVAVRILATAFGITSLVYGVVWWLATRRARAIDNERREQQHPHDVQVVLP